MKYSLVIPCFNESGNIEPFLKRANEKFNHKEIELIIVNNGSTDNSQELLTECLKKYKFLKVKTIENNIGYGNGIIEGLKIAKGNLMGWTHADMQTDPLDYLRAIDVFSESNYKNTFIKGKRINRKFSDKIFTLGMSIFESILLNKIMYDINAQPTLFPKSFFDYWVDPPKDFSLDLYAYNLAISKNYEIKRFPVKFSKRLSGYSKWNIDFKSKLKFIRRTIIYSLKLKFRKYI